MKDESNSSQAGSTSGIVPTTTKTYTIELDKETRIAVEARVLDEELDTEKNVGDRLPKFEAVAGAIEKISKELTRAWQEAGPSRASVELNLEFAWQAGELLAMFVQGSTTASMKITLEWEKP